ncbi:hypothetical protein RHMOL_Rhmol10G0247000 [Rhododendron molle]|uniref:Uncharacterized protein n=1 Tax=Rhododendron molle TaxID=49168 RepID=A0ACC0M5Y2_RHOML|nr:hypothetical protein RHMOL_Rhmol10G0247000 [Rhododendron molle]
MFDQSRTLANYGAIPTIRPPIFISTSEAHGSHSTVLPLSGDILQVFTGKFWQSSACLLARAMGIRQAVVESDNKRAIVL